MKKDLNKRFLNFYFFKYQHAQPFFFFGYVLSSLKDSFETPLDRNIGRVTGSLVPEISRNVPTRVDEILDSRIITNILDTVDEPKDDGGGSYGDDTPGDDRPNLDDFPDDGRDNPGGTQGGEADTRGDTGNRGVDNNFGTGGNRGGGNRGGSGGYN